MAQVARGVQLATGPTVRQQLLVHLAVSTKRTGGVVQQLPPLMPRGRAGQRSVGRGKDGQIYSLKKRDLDEQCVIRA